MPLARLPLWKITTLSIVAVSLNWGSSRSTSGANPISNASDGGIGLLKVPSSESMLGNGAPGSSGSPSSPAIQVCSFGSARLGTGTRGLAALTFPEDSNELGPERRLLMSKAVTL